MNKQRSVTISAHNYEWFGLCPNVIDSVKQFRIAAKCVNLPEFRYQCYAPDPEYDDCCIYFEITDEIIEKLVKSSPQLKDFLLQSHITLVDFELMEITDKLHYLSNFFDIIDLLGLSVDESEAIPIDLVIESLS